MAVPCTGARDGREAWNKLIVKQKFCVSSWLITKINLICNNFCFSKIVPLWDNVEKKIILPKRPQMIIQRMRITRWTTKATNTHSKYVIPFFHWNSGCTNATQCYVIRTAPVFFTLTADAPSRSSAADQMLPTVALPPSYFYTWLHSGAKVFFFNSSNFSTVVVKSLILVLLACVLLP